MMNKKGQIAASAFSALCLGGVLTLFSQAQADRRPSHEMRALDLSSPDDEVFRRMVPAAVKGGTTGRGRAATEEESDRPRRLLLR
ncbi:MAG: hypothetical protein O7J95_06240 [Planctomycetota bacterium]|nr:hypothetical protein [Planctomycetota bacterium]